MKFEFLIKAALGFVLISTGIHPVAAQEAEEPNEKASRYHSLLLKKPGNAMVFSRFVDAWLDTGSKKGLTKWLEDEAKKGGAANWRVLGALHQYLGEDEEALKALNEAVKLDGEGADLRLARAKLQARLLAFEAALIDLEVAAKDEKTAIEASKLKGVYLARSGQIEAAVTAWKEVIKAYPKDEDLREDLIEVQVMEGLYKDAIEASTALVAMTKDPYKKILRQLRLGDIQILGGNRDEGLKTYQAIMAATGEGTWLEREVLAQVERVFLKEDDIKGLRDFYQNLREEYPRRVSIRKVLARQMALNDEIKEAIALFREVLKITPGDVGNREEFIAFLEANEKWNEAKEEISALIEQRKDDALLWERLSRIESKLNDKEGMKEALDKVAELRKGDPEGLLASAALYGQSKLVADAEALLREGLKSFPESLEVSEGLASFLIQNEKEDEALGIWKKMAEGADREGLLRVSRSLNSHGKGSVAFEILAGRIGDFENDPLILTQYCKLAGSKEEAAQAIPQGLALVKVAQTPTELEGAVQTAMRLIARADRKVEVQKSLADQGNPGVTEQCLLAALYSEQGDAIKAAKILTEAAESPGGMLARFYRVRFEEDRGDLEKAISIMREIIETPEGRKTVHLRRLVNLLERTGDFDKALAAVDEWKRIAPGDHSAWLQRARLLQADGRPEEAVTELRRMIGKFGADEERRATLAAALIEAAEYTPAQRIFEQLYQESERLESKLKWAGEMARLAEREGKLAELLEDFDRRKRTNPRSVAPLLAIAEIHRVLDQYEERRSALLEASRRRPEDTNLLARIAEVEERAGEFDRAVGILRDAVKRDKTNESKRRLASLLLKNGEIQSGLDLLSEIPGTVDDPRGLESIVQALVSGRETEHALKFLDTQMPRFETDWRLKYLKGMVLMMESDFESALEIFTELLKPGEEIANLKPLVSANMPNNMGPFAALFGANGWEELTFYQQYVAGRNRGGMGRGGAARIPLPGSPREVQLLSLLQGSSLLSLIPEKAAEEARKTMTLPGIKDVDILSALMSGGRVNGMELLRERHEAEPDNKGLFALHLVYKGFQEGISLEEFEKAEKDLLKDHPETFVMIAYGSLQSAEVPSERLANALRTALADLPRDTTDEMMNFISSMFFSPFGRDSDRKDIKAMKDLMAELALAVEEAPKNWEWIPGIIPHLISEKRSDEGLTLINRLCDWQSKAKGPRQPGGPMSMMFMRSPSRQGNHLVPPSFPPQVLKGVPDGLLRIFPVKPKKESDESDEQAKLLARLQMGQDENEEGPANPVSIFVDRMEEIKSPALRAMAYLSLENEDAAGRLIEKMAESREESSLLFAAGYFYDRDDPRVYGILLKLRMLPLSRDSRKRVDGHLAFIGSELAGKENSTVDLEPAKRAALRLRRVLGGDEREKLGDVLVKLGLKDEAERLASVPKPTVTRPRNPFGSGSQMDRISKLKKDGKLDAAAREAMKQFRMLNNGQQNSWELRELKELVSKHALTKETLKLLDPGEIDSAKRVLEFAQAQKLFGTDKAARPLFEKALKLNPRLMEARIGAIQTTPFDEIDQSELILKKGDKIDLDSTAIVFDSLWESVESDETLDQYLTLAKLTKGFLEELPPSGDPKTNLSWVPYHILRFASNSYLDNRYLGVLVRDGNGWSSGNQKIDKEAAEKRNEAAKGVFLAMIEHPQIAVQGFMLLESGRKGLGLKDSDLVSFGKKALTKSLEKPETSNRFGRNDLWSKMVNNGMTSSGELSNPRGPISWLMAQSAKTGTELLTPELLEKVREARPKEFGQLDLARSLAKAPPENAEKIYAKWKDGLPAQKREKAIEFARQVLLFNPGKAAWADDLEQIMLKPVSGMMGIMGRNQSWVSFVTDWGVWRREQFGSEGYQTFLLRLFESSFGPSEKWPVLAKLGEDGIPQKYQQAGYAFQQVSKSILGSSELAKPTLIFLGKHPLEKFVYDLDDSVEQAWSPGYSRAEDALEQIKERRLLTLEKGEEEIDPFHFLAVAEGIRGIRLSGRTTERANLGELIQESKDLDPVLKTVAAASLLPATKSREIIRPVLEGNLPLVKGIIKVAPERSYKVLRRWFPLMEKSDISAPLKELLEGFAAEARAKKLAEVKSWVENGVPALGDRDADDFWPEVLQFVSIDETLTHQLASRILVDVSKVRNRGWSSTNGVKWTQQDRWASDLLSLIQRGKSEIDIPAQIRLIDAIYRSGASSIILEPIALRNYSYDWVWEEFLSLAGQDSDPMVAWLEALNEGQQAALAVYLVHGMLGESSEKLDLLKPHEELFKNKAPALAAAYGLALNSNKADATNKEEFREKAREHYLKILNLKELPLSLKVELLARVNRKSKSLHASPEVFKAIAGVMEEYGDSKRNFAASSLNGLMKGLAGLEFPEMKGPAGEVAKQAGAVLLSPVVSTQRTDPGIPPVASDIVKLALKSDDGALASTLLRRDYAAFRGKLEVMVNLARSGDFETMGKLLVPKVGIYNSVGLPNYDQKFHELVEKMNAGVPPENRYHLKVVLSNQPDPSKGNLHELNREERLLDAAEKFDELGGELKGSARHQVLAIFSAFDSTAEKVEKHLRKEADAITLAESIIFRSNSNQVERMDSLTIVRRAMSMEIEAGNVEPVIEKLTEFTEAMSGDGSGIWKLRNHFAPIFNGVVRDFVMAAARDKDAAAKLAPQFNILFGLATKVPSDSDLLNTLDGGGLIIYSLAGDGGSWNTFLEKLGAKEKKTYERFSSKRGRNSLFEDLNSSRWKKAENAELRAKVLRTILDSPVYQARDLGYVHDFYGLSESGLFSFQEVVDGVKSLPNDHPLKAEGTFHIASVITYKLKDLEAGFATYQEAIDIALGKGDDKKANQILAHRCDVFFRNGKKERAKEDAASIKVDLLPERDKSWVEKALPKWLK